MGNNIKLGFMPETFSLITTADFYNKRALRDPNFIETISGNKQTQESLGNLLANPEVALFYILAVRSTLSADIDPGAMLVIKDMTNSGRELFQMSKDKISGEIRITMAKLDSTDQPTQVLDTDGLSTESLNSLAAAYVHSLFDVMDWQLEVEYISQANTQIL